MPALASRNTPVATMATAATTTTLTSAATSVSPTITTTVASVSNLTNNEYSEQKQQQQQQEVNNHFYTNSQSPPPLPPPLGQDVDNIAPGMELAASSVLLNGNLKAINVTNGNQYNNNNNSNNNSNSLECNTNVYNNNNNSKSESSSSLVDGYAGGSGNKKTLSPSASLLHSSREDVVSLGGASSITSQLSAATINNNSNNNNIMTTEYNNLHNNNNNNNNKNNDSINNNKNNENIGGILKNNKESYYNGNDQLQNTYGGTGPKFIAGEDPGDGLGPLPAKWETAYTERGELYFIDHNTGTSHWLDPRLSKYQKKSLEDCGDDELPYGWEKIEDALYGTYYIDHVNRKTQYENPVLEAKRRAAEQNKHQQQQPPPPPPPPPPQQQQQPEQTKETVEEAQQPIYSQPTTATNGKLGLNKSPTKSKIAAAPILSDISKRGQLQPPAMLPTKFTRNPDELQGERIRTQLVKSPRGLGITIVGGDEGGEEFLQIKSIVPYGAAWLDAKLQTGDVLIYVNNNCVLGFTHQDMVSVFQHILPGETVTLEVCRGYMLPFDPNDPNTEVVTTNAIDNVAQEPLHNVEATYSVPHNNRAYGGFILKKKPEVITVNMIKSATGFGFTIADCDEGQKVKKILDRQCSADIQEGDILLEINGINVQHKTHQEVVQLLKDCSKVQLTQIKLQRQPTSNENNQNTLSSNVAKLRKNFLSNVALFRSKTPTAELYSTQQKEILPMRPKTPLVDTRRARVQTPVQDMPKRSLNVSTDSADNLDGSMLGAQKNAKSSNSLQDIEVMNPDIPYLDPYPKMVASLGERLAEATLNSDSLGAARAYEQQEYVSTGPYHATYALPNSTNLSGASLHHNTLSMTTNTQPLYAAVGYPQQPLPNAEPLTHQRHQPHDSCYCYDCQDFRAANRFRASQGMNYQSHYSPSGLSTATLPSNMPLHSTHLQNERIQKRVNELLNDRRKIGFSYDATAQQQQQHSPSVNSLASQNNWVQQPQQSTFLDHIPEAEQYELAEVTLERQSTGFGFRIVGGTEEGSQVTVGHVVPGGAADMDHRINMGDEILSIDGISVLNTSHHKVVSLMGEAATRGYVTMILRRRMRNNNSLHQQPMQQYALYVNQQQQQQQQQPQSQQQQQPIYTPSLQQQLQISPGMPHFPYDVIVNRHENEGFGFVIISSTNQYYGSTIGKLIPGSPADRCGELKVGDRIVAVNRIDIAGMPHGDVVNLIKESGLHVRLTIGSPKELVSTGLSPNQISNNGSQNSPRLLLTQPSPTMLPLPTESQQQQNTSYLTNSALPVRDSSSAYYNQPQL